MLYTSGVWHTLISADHASTIHRLSRTVGSMATLHTYHTSCIIHHTSHCYITHHTSYNIIYHSSYITHHTSYIIHHTTYVTQHTWALWQSEFTKHAGSLHVGWWWAIHLLFSQVQYPPQSMITLITQQIYLLQSAQGNNTDRQTHRQTHRQTCIAAAMIVLCKTYIKITCTRHTYTRIQTPHCLSHTRTYTYIHTHIHTYVHDTYNTHAHITRTHVPRVPGRHSLVQISALGEGLLALQ